ncbi:aminotransferase class V-fold PLP-dependent enzyme [Nocardioides sp. CBS4Y-1]|uniref:Aminotransferase class V-fold PLP-dependent enzyme n=2 Tax=Nocardioides acrostichi TaxID=2784339 RepID=A0A930YBJ6_9ACTN|nr:aminotransferase class V-fold PLP-dependent enzyme [Nocardioides acrostichi]
MTAAQERGFADPRALHGAGRDARLLLDNAREVVAECLGLRREEVFFTSPVDAVQRGMLGLAAARVRVGGHVVHSAVEHAHVRHAALWWAGSHGGETREVPVDLRGAVAEADVISHCAGAGVAVAAVQLANHEVGTVQPVGAFPLPDGVPMFVDASPALGHLDLPAEHWSAAAGHATAWGGPPGVGVMIVRRGARWTNPFPGDPAPTDAGGGLPDVPGALAAAAALRATLAEHDEVAARQRRLVDRIREAAAAVPDTDVVGDPRDRLPHLVTFSCLYVPGEALVRALDRHGFGVASGSACTASTLEPSHVLAAMGALTHGNVRVSLGRQVTEAQVERFCAVLPGVVQDLRAEIGL